ncbi:Adhesion G-protein coupled receptor G2 [Larimichthys crocea]|uniref:Adhesion G-protein coupled receptor G2 n=1 Tax=Larimichthys crocea TaxID=215358 RepID=A0A6G0HKX4_LARCR|nr:Adhesion G-protein coupled receptor G2 [Larimichthys crocea]
MYGLCFEGQWRWTYHLLLIIWLLLLAATPPKALGYFLGDTKAVLHGCEDHWTLQDRTSMPLLFQMTVCVDIRVTVPGSWVAFSYSSVHAPRPELGLEGDDKAVYGWLLRVRHRFPVELSPTVWHRVCLRRDVPRNSFSLEVDGKMVAARTVIAQAISPSGSLWLGCRPRDRPPGASLGEVELYMFRMWNDLDHHGVCEDGTVIGWSAQYWGLTSPRARQRDPNLLCDAYFWMSIHVEVKEGDKNEQDVQNLVSDAFGCSGNISDTASDKMDFCLAVEVNCVAKSQISTTTCDVLLQRSVAVSACEVQREGVSALQIVGGEQIEVNITREVERVGRYHCEDTAPSSGGFVRCASTSSLEDICQANKASTVTCSLIEPDSNPDPQPVSKSCSRRGPHFCDCAAFCESQRHFFATRINITSDAVNVDLLKSLLSQPRLAQSCGTTSNCQDSYEKVHLECHGTQQRLFSCMVILEMSGSVDICSLNESLQELIDSNADITNDRPLTRMMICGPPDLSVDTLLKSNLTWVDSDLLTSDVCQPDLLECDQFNHHGGFDHTWSTFDHNHYYYYWYHYYYYYCYCYYHHRLYQHNHYKTWYVAQLTGQLEKLLDGPTVSQAVGQKAVNIISNLMEGDALALAASANRLIRVVDDLGLKLVVTGDKEIVSSSSLVLAVKTVDGINFPTTSVDILNTDNVQFSDISRSPALGSVYLPSSLTTGLRPEEQQQASRVQFTYFTKSTLFQDATLDNQTSVSPILGSSVANLSISNLSENISFTIRNINFPQKNYTVSCVFWNFSLHDGLGGWSSNGCSVINTTSEETTCSCNHLTSFAILLDLSRDGLQDRQQVQILTFITYIGCGLSAVFLAVTLLTYLSFEKLLRDIPAKILVQLCISLLLLNLLFLLDGWLAIYPATGLCISTAFFLHYFLLTSFTWAGLEALHMYLSVIRVFTPYLSRYMLKFSLMGWGIPLIVVIVVISVDKDNYGLVTYGKYTDGTTDDFCWLRNNIAFYVAVVGYFVLIFALCLLVFIMVMVQLARIKRQNPQNQSPNRGVMTDMRSIAGLVILLGLTWGFALFAWGPLYLPFVYLFTIFNTLQGFLVFVFHCAVKENVRRQWRTYLCCGRLRLAENSEWSRTATQNTKNISGATATASAPRLPSRTSSVISDGTNSNSSLYLDSGISDCTGSDVVLNEIHRQNMSP